MFLKCQKQYLKCIGQYIFVKMLNNLEDMYLGGYHIGYEFYTDTLAILE